MSNWATLKHAYGSAEDVPALLAQITPDPKANVWDELWSRLYHQGTVYSASFAALPAILAVAEQWNPKERAQLLVLAASILTSDDVYGGRRDDFFRPVEWVWRRFQQACRESLAEFGLSSHDFIYLLQAARTFEGDQFWGRELDHLAEGEFPGACPHCGVDLYVVIGEYGFFTTAEDWVARSEEPGKIQVRRGVKCRPIEPNKGVLPETGEWLYECAHASQQDEVARWIRYVFGSTDCPTCQQVILVTDAIQQP